ncbi:hypothetical protein [uncultured Lutibacter sp.]|uniref:hypothetical protein n=1 Tax=uncultured Lutibacter sp. TaxID=437739 RepID=UPI00263A00A9|nr:hypothetical protein [uncultured Lutibacter sp.]
MKKIVFLLVLIISIISCKTENKKVEEVIATETIETPILALSEFDIKAGNYINKEVIVQGIVDHVCKHGGKKILLVTDNGRVHITSEERFDEALMGNEIALTGIVLEERIDEAYCLKMEEDNIKSHSEGNSNDEQFIAKKNHVQEYRDQMKANNTDHISNYSLDYVSHTEVK